MLFELGETKKFEHLFLNLIDFNLHIEQEYSEEYFKWLVLYKHLILSDEKKEGSTINKVMEKLEVW